MYVCKQTFHASRVRISQKVKGVTMRNLRLYYLIASDMRLIVLSLR